MSYFDQYRDTLFRRVANIMVTRIDGALVEANTGFTEWISLTRETKRTGGVHYFIGNGASATMASHMALDSAKNAGLRATSFNDIASLTAVGNDLGYDQIFATPLSWQATPADLLVAISSSGKSPSILSAIATARKLGLKVITLSGMQPDNPAARSGDLNFYVPGRTYGAVECAHQIILHCWLDEYMGLTEWN